MRALSVARLVVATAAFASVSCSIWAALDSPYKNDQGFSGVDADASGGGPADAGGQDVTIRAFDAGFVPGAIGVYGDTVYAVDDQAQVHVAYDASTRFTSFWAGDAGGVFLLQKNGVAVSAAGVFWTVSTGVHYCGIDAGGCGLFPSTNARAIAASDSVVAWIDDTGVRICTAPLDTCSPATLTGSRSAARVAAGPNASVAWTDGGGTIIHLSSGLASGPIDLSPYEVDVIATDPSSGDLYWEGPYGIGFLGFDGGTEAVSNLYSMTKSTALFADRGVAYWSLASNVVQHCRFDPDGGCSPRDLAPTGLRGSQTTHAIVANSRKVLAIVSSGTSMFLPTLVEWPLPP